MKLLSFLAGVATGVLLTRSMASGGSTLAPARGRSLRADPSTDDRDDATLAPPRTDAELRDRIRARIARTIANPEAIQVDVADGCVTLRGQVQARDSATWALRAQFFVAGALFATWGVHVPSIKAHYGLGEQSLAIAMLASGVGAVVALLQAGRVLARHAPRGVVPMMACCACAIGSLLALALRLLLALMLAYGMAAALFDVAINDEATAIEREAGVRS
jgi:hypothetical protein